MVFLLRYELKYAFPEGVPFAVDDRSGSDYTAPVAGSGAGYGSKHDIRGPLLLDLKMQIHVAFF